MPPPEPTLAATATPVAARHTVVTPPGPWPRIDLGELWSYRELLFFLTWRDLKVRYKQTGLGALWILLQPLIATAIFTVLFGRLLQAPSDGLPYSLFVLSALVPWNTFAASLNRAATSLVGNAHLLRKVYFPRLVLPISAVLAGLVDLAITLTLLAGLMAWHGVRPGTSLIWLPAFLLLELVFLLGLGFFLAAVNVRYRDVTYVLPFLTQVWMYLTPVVYSASLLPAASRPLLALNPMAVVVDGFRLALLGVAPATLTGPRVVLASAAGILVLVAGARYFRRAEVGFADVV